MTEQPVEADQTSPVDSSSLVDRPRVAGRGEEVEVSLLHLSSVLLKRRWTIVRTVAVMASLALVVALLTEKKFTASTSFLPQTEEGSLSSLAGLAGQFGVQVPTGNAGESPEFYAELVMSRAVLGTIAMESFSFEVQDGESTGTVQGMLPDLLEIEKNQENQALRRHATIRWLRQTGVSVSTERTTGTVRVSVQTPWAGLSLAVAQRILELVNEFNLQTRQSEAAAEREFVEGRLAEAQDSLLAAEDRQEAFLEANRQWANSPELTFQHERLARQVLVQQQVYTSLAQAFEQARIAEVRNTPVITVVDRPELPARADPRRRILKLALGIILGGMLGVFVAFGQEYVSRAQAEEEEEYRELSNAWAQTWADVKTLGGRLGGGTSGTP